MFLKIQFYHFAQPCSMA